MSENFKKLVTSTTTQRDPFEITVAQLCEKHVFGHKNPNTFDYNVSKLVYSKFLL